MSEFNHKNVIKVRWLNLETNSVIAFVACASVLFIFGKLFVLPMKKILKVIMNSFLGGILIYIINIVGASFNFHIGLNLGTSIFIGILGVPGVVLLVILKFMIWQNNFIKCYNFVIFRYNSRLF